MPLKVALLHKSLSTMLANNPNPIVHSFLVSCNIFLPLGLVRAQFTEEKSIFILGRWVSMKLVFVESLPSMGGKLTRVTLKHLAGMCLEHSDAV